MAHFLLIYDRAAGSLLRKDQFVHRSDAMRARFAAEAEFRDRTNVEVVVFDAASEADLRQTHGRYFLSVAELSARIG